MMPLCRSTISIISAKKSLSRATVSSAGAHARHGGEAPDVEEQHAHPAHLARRVAQRGEQPVDHGGRDVLAEQVGDAVARRRRGDRRLELPAQAAGHDAGDDAAGQQHDAAAEMVGERSLRHLGKQLDRQQPGGQDQQLHGRDGAGPQRQPEIEPQRRQQDEHEIEHRRPVAEHRGGSMWRLSRKMMTLGRLVSTRALAKRPMRGKSLSWAARQRRTNSTTTSYRKNGPMAASGIPAGDAAAEHAQGEFGEEVGGDQGGGEQGGQHDGQHPHALDLAAHDLAAQFIGVAVRGCFSHRRQPSQPPQAPQRQGGMLGTRPCR